MKRLKKTAFRILILVCTGILAIIAYFEIGGYFLLGEDREVIGKEIREAPALPYNFLKMYTAVYPDALSTGLWSHIGSEIVYGRHYDCPCRDAAYPYIATRGAGDFYESAIITFQVEDMATQQECLEFVLKHMDFSNGIIGIENAAKYYYNKNLDEIYEDEALELVVIARNPGLYNKKRRPELVKQEAEELKQKLINNK
jgi:hypothetical protein